MKQTFPSSTVRNSDTFFKELEKVGIVKYEKRRKINGKNKKCCDIVFSEFEDAMKKLYPTFQLVDWVCVCDPKIFENAFEKYKSQKEWFS
jgi:hypothetical protein